jgi:hypothetical protein
MSFRSSILTLALFAVATAQALADGKTKAAQEIAELLLQKFGREAAKDGVSTLARRIEQAAITHGDDVFRAIRRVGPRALPLIEQSGNQAKQVARLLSVYGEAGAVYVANRPQAMQLILRHGERAAAALVKSRGLALPVVESFGEPAIRAFQALASAQNARRLAMMQAGGELAKIGRTPDLLAVIATWGDAGMEFIWKHKEALAVSAALAAFVADPRPFINGAKDLSQVVVENVVRPIANVPAIAAQEGAAEIARNTNWTLVFLVMLAPLAILATTRWGLFRPAAVLLTAGLKRLPVRRPPTPVATDPRHLSPSLKENTWDRLS